MRILIQVFIELVGILVVRMVMKKALT